MKDGSWWRWLLKVRWKRKVLPAPCSVPFFSASKCCRLSRGELPAKAVLGSHEAPFGVCAQGRGGWTQPVGLFCAFLRSEWPVKLWSCLPWASQQSQSCITLPGNAHLLLLQVVAGRNNVELVAEVVWESFQLCAMEQMRQLLKQGVHSTHSQVINQARLCACLFWPNLKAFLQSLPHLLQAPLQLWKTCISAKLRC